MTKKILALVLAVLMICTLGVIPVSAASAVAEIGTTEYTSLQAAFDAVQDGETIVLLSDVVLEPQLNSGSYYDGIIYRGDKSFTFDLGGFELSGASGINDYLIYLDNRGTKANEITIKNGTIEGGSNLWSVICVSGGLSTKPTTLNLGAGLTVNGDSSSNSGEDCVAKVRNNKSVMNVCSGATVTSTGALYGVQAIGDATVNIYDGATITHNYNNPGSIAVTGTGKCNVYGGTITSANVAVQPSSSGTPTITISGGEITAPKAVVSGSDWNSYPDASSSVTISGGKLEGDVIAQAWGTTTNEDASISLTVTGGELKNDIIVDANCSADIRGGTVASVTVASGATATISGGTIKGELTADTEDLTVTGGKFENESVQNNILNYAPTGSTIVGGQVLSPVKIPQKSRVSFVADGRLVGIVLYRKSQTELTFLPKVPAKEGYVGAWAEYELNGENMIVRAVYTPIAE